MPKSDTAARRVELGELAVRLDDKLTTALALHLGRGTDQVLSLLQSVLWRVPWEQRVELLQDALWRTGLHDEVPFLAPSLALVFRIRNQLAHSVTYRETEDRLTLLSLRNGKRRTVTVTREQLDAALAAGVACDYLYFGRIEGRLGDATTWGQLFGFDEH